MADVSRQQQDRPVREREHPERTCAVTRQTASPDLLIRFTYAPSGEVVPDLQQRLPGRGIWVGCRRGLVQQAIKRNAFARGLKADVTTAGDLDLRVDRLLEDAALQWLSLANKAGLVVAGQGKVDNLIASGLAAVLVQANDASEGGRDRLQRKHHAVARDVGRDPMTVEHFNVEQLSLALGRSNVVHAALAEGRATSSFARAAGRLVRYRSETPFDPGSELSNDTKELAKAETARAAVQKTGIV